MDFHELVERIADGVELGGIAVMVVGVVVSLATYLVSWPAKERRLDAYEHARKSVGRSILLGLELLVAGDIIRTVAVSPSFQSVGVLAGIVAIRTFLSFVLELEITGRWPWQGSSA